jgi:flagellar hook protein FlgE
MSFRIALTGLGAAAADLGITADNIANANTNGFKQSRTEFADLVAGNGRGTNIVGDGVQIASVSQNFSQGNISFTGNPLDLAISGKGFFRVDSGGSTAYSRSGVFGTDREGFIVNPLGQQLTGFTADADGNITGNIASLQVNTGKLPPRATGAIEVGANLNAADTAPATAFDAANPATFNDSTSLTFFDSLGTPHVASIFFRKTGANAWENFVTVDNVQVGGATAITFDTAGQLTAPAGGTLNTASFTPAGAAAQTISIDLNQVTQFGSGFGINFLLQDGFSSGQLAGVEIEESGVLFARYTNGESLALGQVALTDFANAQGLTRVGDNSWAESFSSGQPLTGAPDSATLGIIKAGSLEDSNVELTEQLVDVINSQRSFQANAQVITASDQLTQTILNIN